MCFEFRAAVLIYFPNVARPFRYAGGIRICDGSSGIAFIVTRSQEMTEEVAAEEEDDAGCPA
jgi:hypothetical protein